MNDDRIFNPRGLRHYRKKYSVTEARWGALILLGLVSIGGGVAWMGAHPPSNQFGDTSLQLNPGRAPVERGPLPEQLAAEGFAEANLASFDAESLYKKINGRADFFLERGFSKLTFLTLRHSNKANLTVDVEFYDMGDADNAISAYQGEKPADAASRTERGGRARLDRNALFLARGKFYVRAIGSAEDELITSQLKHLEARLFSHIAAGERPWSYAILVDALGVPEAEVSFVKENAFSFDFAQNVFTATLEQGEVFVLKAPSTEEAERLAERFREGFASLGEVQELEGRQWVQDRYLRQLSTAAAERDVVYGVRGAANGSDATATFKRLAAAVAGP